MLYIFWMKRLMGCQQQKTEECIFLTSEMWHGSKGLQILSKYTGSKKYVYIVQWHNNWK